MTKYSFAFTSTSLRWVDLRRLARYSVEEGISDLRQLPAAELSVTYANQKTTQKVFRELVKRLELLTPDQLQILATGDKSSSLQIALLATCKRYTFIRDFIIEVVREKHLLLDYQLHPADYQKFWNQKSERHPAMNHFTPATIQKIRQVTFKVLEQAELIDNVKNRQIQPPIVDPVTRRAFANDQPVWLKILLLSDTVIQQQKSLE